ncbi:MAG: hypothetical protein HY719_02000, partial [Planctomycetes bacterium]|nr:hypothetical protein [Planctomycetota bacterium]
MDGSRGATIHEVDFCALVASAANELFKAAPEAYHFSEARVEGLTPGDARHTRADLRLLGPDGAVVVSGEVKMPGSAVGATPYDVDLIGDAQTKAREAGARFFFTWNVNAFVLFDRSRWSERLVEQRVREWRLGLTLTDPPQVAAHVGFIRERFLPDLLRDLADIVTGRRANWAFAPDELFIRSLESRLDWPVQVTAEHLEHRAERDRRFDAEVQRWLGEQGRLYLRGDPVEWRAALVNMARTLAYVWANRIIFYKALRTRFGD